MTRPAIALLSLLVVGCSDHEHEHGAARNDHADHGDDHADDHAGGHGHGDEDAELPARSVTVWTEKSELFMEYSPLIAGTESRFLAHVTALDGFLPLREGQVTLTIATSASASAPVTAKGATRPGIFIPVFIPSQAGDCTLSVEIKSETLVDRIDAGACRIFADRAAAIAALAGEDDSGGAAISFLKEQQWVIDFATTEVTERELQPGVRVNADIRAVPDREARLTAPTAGRVVLPRPVPVLGTAVTKGQLLASIQPTATASGNYGALVADVDGARAELAAATAQRDRLARLVADDAVPRRRLDDADAAVKVARARLDAATTRLAAYNASARGATAASSGAFRIRAPLAGTLVDVRVTSGETVDAGALLFSLIDLDRVWVTGQLFEADLPGLDGPGSRSAAAWFQVEGRDQVFEIESSTGRLVTVGSVIDPQTRTVPVVFEVDNRARSLRIGQFATLTIATGKPTRALAVPESALISEAGQSVAYVQTEGESFARRIVRTGVRSRGWVEVRGGLAAGEHVVSTGAYDVKLAASAGSTPAHGHSH
jgi:RND family efflux transporter MFP subunit